MQKEFPYHDVIMCLIVANPPGAQPYRPSTSLQLSWRLPPHHRYWWHGLLHLWTLERRVHLHLRLQRTWPHPGIFHKLRPQRRVFHSKLWFTNRRTLCYKLWRHKWNGWSWPHAGRTWWETNNAWWWGEANYSVTTDLLCLRANFIHSTQWYYYIPQLPEYLPQ